MWWTNGVKFDPDKDIGDLGGKIVVVTGGNDGLGKETTAIRDVETIVPGVNIKVLELDLASFASVPAAVSKFKAQSEKLHVLINNAGISNVPAGTTEDGYEIQFGTNHLGHALLTKLLLPTMLKTAAESDTGGNPWYLYAQSKLANILHAKALTKRYPTITSIAVHPGSVHTRIFEKMNSLFLNVLIAIFGWAMLLSLEEGAKNQLWAATAAGVESGSYYTPVGVQSEGAVYASDEDLADRLWEWTETELQKHGH